MDGYFCGAILDVKFVFGDLVSHFFVDGSEEICVGGITDIRIIQSTEIVTLEKVLHGGKIHVLHTCEKFFCGCYRFMALNHIPGSSAGHCSDQKNDQAYHKWFFAFFLSAWCILFEIIGDQ